MTDTVQSVAGLLALFASGQAPGTITPQYLRELIISLEAGTILTVLSLRTFQEDVPFVVTHGYWTAGDGGGGLFRYDSTDTTTADDGFTVLVDGSNRRWKRFFDGDRVDVRWFGCTPSATGIQMRDGARAASLYLYNQGGGEMWIPGGIYAAWNVARPVVLSSNISLIGDPGKTIIVPDLTTAVDGTSFPYPQAHGGIFMTGNPSITVGGASYAGTRAGTTTGGGNNAVNLGYVDSTTIIKNITVDGITIDATLSGSGGVGLTYSGPVYGVAQMLCLGIFFTFVQGCTITRTKVKGTPNSGIGVSYGRDVKIDNCVASLCGYWGPLGSDCNGISCSGWMDNRNISMTSVGLQITNNFCEGNHDEGIMASLWDDMHITGNTLVGNGDKAIEGNSPLATSLTAANGGTLPAWVTAATVTAGGSGGTNGTQRVTGTTGTGTLPVFLVTVAGGAITAVLRIIVPGNYLTLPTTHTAEPVTGAGLSGATLNLTLQGQKIPGDRIIQGNMINGTIPSSVPWLPYGVSYGIEGIGTADGGENAIDVLDNQISYIGNATSAIAYPATVTAASVINGGSGGTNGTQTVTGTTAGPTFFTASVTVAGGAITAVLSITNAGSYNWPPTDITNEPVTGAGLVGATLNLTMSYTSNPTSANTISLSQTSHSHFRVLRNRLRNNQAGMFFSCQRIEIIDNEVTGTANTCIGLSSGLFDLIVIRGNKTVGTGRFVTGTIGASGVTGLNWIIDISDNEAFECSVSPIQLLWNCNAASTVALLQIHRNHFGQMNQSSSFSTSYIGLGAVSSSTNTPTIGLLSVMDNVIDATSGHQVDYPIGKPQSAGWFDLKASAITKAIIRDNNLGTPGFGGGGNLPTLFDSGMTSAIVAVDQSNPGFPGYQPIRGFWSGTLPSVGVELWAWIADRAVTIPAAVSGALAFSYGSAKNGQTATSSHVFPLQKNGTTVGDLNIAASASTFTFTVASPIVLAAGDQLTLLSDATDATLTAFAFVLGGY